jgi:hypothetical protein
MELLMSSTMTTQELQTRETQSAPLEARQEPRSAKDPFPQAKQDPQQAQTSPTPDEIAAEAYALFAASGYEHGHDLEHWLAAEQRLNALHSQ